MRSVYPVITSVTLLLTVWALGTSSAQESAAPPFEPSMLCQCPEPPPCPPPWFRLVEDSVGASRAPARSESSRTASAETSSVPLPAPATPGIEQALAYIEQARAAVKEAEAAEAEAEAAEVEE
jgi:hypothetical protein